MNGTRSERTAIAFMVHFFNREVEERLEKLLNDCATRPGEDGPYDVFILADDGTPVPDRYADITHMFDFSKLRTRVRTVIGDRIVPGNCHLRALDFWEHHYGYAHYWFIEYDVLYTGHWRDFLSQFDDDGTDLLVSHITELRDDPDWHWRDRFSTGSDHIDPDDRLYALLSLHRISAAGLERVREACEHGWTGHFEGLVPTAVATGGLTIADLGGSGSRAPQERVNRNYLSCAVPPRYDAFATLRWRPYVLTTPIANLLYHPCKTKGEVPRWRIGPSRIVTIIRYPGATLHYAFAFAKRLARSRFRGGAP